MRLAYVVEGSQVFDHRGRELLNVLWREEIAAKVGHLSPQIVLGINKGSIASMRLAQTALKRTTSIAEPLDLILERFRVNHNIDCFVVVWDLLPPWDRDAGLCRWTETLGFYEGLSLSGSLDGAFRECAGRRYLEMRGRQEPGLRGSIPRLERGAIIAVCVEPLFESVFMDQGAMKACLGLRNIRVKGWPRGWSQDNRNACGVIADAVDAARETRPRDAVYRKIRDGYETLKTEWGIHFLKSGCFDQTLGAHQLGRRLGELRAVVIQGA